MDEPGGSLDDLSHSDDDNGITNAGNAMSAATVSDESTLRPWAYTADEYLSHGKKYTPASQFSCGKLKSYI